MTNLPGQQATISGQTPTNGHIINAGEYDTAGLAQSWKGSYSAALAKSNAKVIAAVDEHSSASDKELLAALLHTYLQPTECAEEDTPFTGPTTIIDEKRIFCRRDRHIQREGDIHSLIQQNPGEQKAQATGQLPGPQNHSSDESITESG